MAVYVDRLFDCEGRAGWPWSTACHLYADTLDELHDFSVRLELERKWFQDKLNFPHYDLTAPKRALAVNLGAIEADRAHGCEFRRKLRKDRKMKREVHETIKRVWKTNAGRTLLTATNGKYMVDAFECDEFELQTLQCAITELLSGWGNAPFTTVRDGIPLTEGKSDNALPFTENG